MSEPTPGRDAAPFYYLTNFEFALEDIGVRYADVLRRPEMTFLAAFPSLPVPARALLVRMLMRRPTVFRLSQLCYPEIGAPSYAMAPLIASGWLDPAPMLTLREMCALLRRRELQACLPDVAPRMTKHAMREALSAGNHAPRSMSAWSPQFCDPVLRVLIAPLCERLRLLFFGNYHQDWSTFVLSHLKMLRFERTAFSAASRAFERAEDLDRLHQLYGARRRLENGEDPADVLSVTPAASPANDWIETKRHKLLYRIGFALERAGRVEEAQAVYGASEYPESYIRAARLQERQGRWRAALQSCEHALRRCHAELDRGRLLRTHRRLSKRLGMPVDPGAPSVAPHNEVLALNQAQGAVRIELLVRDELQRRHPHAKLFYVENTLITGLFGLLCWDIIFAALPGAFFHPFQREPADLTAADFYSRREALFRARLAQLFGGNYRHIIKTHYDAKYGITNAFVHWKAWSPELVDLALTCIPAGHLHGWFDILARDRAANRTGFPDLVEFRPDEVSYRLIEVKGPGDRLQENQRRCLGICARLGMPVMVCHVTFAATGSCAA